MLAPAIQRGVVDVWDDTKITPGTKWKEEIQMALGSASIAVLLVSQNFLASHFVAENELPPLLKAAQEQGVTIFWIYLSSCLFEQTEIASYQAAHDTSRPLDRLTKSQRQAVLSEACVKLIRATQEVAAPPTDHPTGTALQAARTQVQAAQKQADAQDPFAREQFSDEEVLDVVEKLRKIQQRQGTEFVGRRELLQELDRLFNRKTFRFEPLRRCPEQRWADRLDSAYQTQKVLRDWERNVREVAEDKYPIYIDLLKEVGSYCMWMGALLFDPAVDYNRIKDHIGKTTFKAQLPAEIRFPVGSDKQPIIPDQINNPIERHRKRAVALMNRLGKG